MTKRVFLAGLLGGVAMFAWNSVAHMATGLGDAGMKEIPTEPPVLQTMFGSIGRASGFYFFPSSGLGPEATAAERRAAMGLYEKRMAIYPSGILIYHPPGTVFNMGEKLGVEFLTEMIEAMLVILLLAQTRLTGFGARLGFVTAAGFLVAIWTNISYWNWYGFPVTYTAAYMTTQIAGFVCVGLVAGAVLRERK